MKNNFQIKNIKAREILDSRGEPTVEVGLETDFGIFQASVPSGASKGKYEALELRDGRERYKGKGVLKAVRNIEEIIAPKLKDKEIENQKELDEILISLDGTENKSRLGANAMLPVSMACCRAAAAAQKTPLYQYIAEIYTGSARANSRVDFSVPKACFNIINGGVHAGNDLDIQEFMIAPQLEKFSDNLRAASEVYHTLKEILKEKHGKNSTNVGDEGGFAPPISRANEALDLIGEAVSRANYSDKVKLGLDCAADEYLMEGGPPLIYKIEGKEKNINELLEYYQGLVEKYPIIFIEDPFAEDDFEGFNRLTEKLGERVLVVGDDLLATNPQRMKRAREKNLCGAMILKINQIGTITEAMEAAKLARDFGWEIIVSHRSGETCDGFIADLAVAIGADFIKSGAPVRGERVTKYNRLLKIEEEISEGC